MWSPDGSQLATSVMGGFELLNEGQVSYSATDVIVLETQAPFARPALRPLTTDGVSRSPDWSPDGQRLTFVSGGHIYVVGIGGGDRARVTRDEGSYASPRWSPDGARIVFTGVVRGAMDVFVMNADGTDLFNVTRHPADRAPRR